MANWALRQEEEARRNIEFALFSDVNKNVTWLTHFEQTVRVWVSDRKTTGFSQLIQAHLSNN